MKHKERLDVLLVARNLAESRSKAQAMIMAGEVYVNEQKAAKVCGSRAACCFTSSASATPARLFTSSSTSPL